MSDHDWGVSELDVYRTMRALREEDRQGALATIVGVEGSAYRRPGAKMIVAEDGGSQGLITAGCIEDEVMELVNDVLESGEPRLDTYDLMEDDDVWGLGLGCNGIIDVLVEPLDSSHEPLLDAFEQGKPVGVITVLDGDGTALPMGARAYYRDGAVSGTERTLPRWFVDAVRHPAATLVEQGKADEVRLEYEGADVRVFIDGIAPVPRLLVLGSGPDVGPVVELGTKNGFQVEVVSFRGAVDIEAEFPRADDHHSTTPANLLEAAAPDERTHAVVMSHNFIDDQIAVEELIESEAPYIGLMGPQERFDEMLEAFADEGISVDDGDLERVYTPIGLDLGSGTPYGIATSIIAEVLAVHNDKEPRHLADQTGPIHDRARLEAPVE